MDYINIMLNRDDFHQRLGGGLPRGSLMIIEGEEGMGKSIISQRITYGALQNNHTVTYISTELNTLDFIRTMSSIKYDVVDYLLDKKLNFITLLPYFGRIIKGENLIFKLKEARQLFDTDIFILDSLSYPLISEMTDDQILDLIQFFNKVKARDKLIILTYDPAIVPARIVSELRRIADIYFKLNLSTLGGQMTRYIDIKRFRNAKSFYDPVIPFRVDPGLGFIVEIVTVV